MDDDDEFGDLYTDVLRPPPAHPQPSLFTSPVPAPAPVPAQPAPSKPAAVASNSLFRSDDDDDEEDDGDILRGDASSGPPPAPATSSQPPGQSVVPGPQGGENEDWMLGEAPAPEEQPADWNDEEDGDLGRVSSTQEADLLSEREEFRVSFEEEEDEEEEVVAGVLEGRQEEAEGDDQGIVVPQGAVVNVAGRNATEAMETDDGIGDLDQEPVIPGLSSASAAPSSVHGVNGGDDKVSRSDDLDSDSEDDLQIVLNDDNLGHFSGNRNRVGGVEDEDGEDGEEDLVIVTDEDQHHHHQVMEEQEWGDELMQQGLDGENNEALDSKVNGGIGARIGYISHGFHGQHHSQYKYIRPGAAAMAGGAAVGSGPPPGQIRPLAMGPMVGRPRGMQKGFHSGYGLSLWAGGASGRAYGTGLEFTLPSHKTIFDVDIDGFEEKPWKLPGIDISDFFNFGLDEDSWRDYRKQLEQLRLEATMQSKIRVYESGRSEQDYDPDLPPELAAATGVQDVYAGNSQLGKTDGGQADLIGPGRGAMRSQQQLPTGRAIQVESGYGERLPSIDTRPPRIRDSDAIIEIVLQDSFGDSITSNGPLDQQPYQCEKQEFKGDNKVEDCDRAPDSEHFDRSPSYGGRKRENKKGSFMGSADSNVIEGNGILPSPSDVPMQYRSNSKSRSPIYAGDLQSASRAARWTKQSSREKYSHVNDHNPNDADARQNDKLPVDDDQKEKSEGSAEAKGSSQMSPTAPLETAGEVILEEGGSDQNDHPFLDDIAEIEDKETALNLPLSDETHGDIDSHHAVKKQKLTSRVEQPCFQGDGIDSRVTHSDDSRAKSGSSKDYMKRREGGEEEVVQRRRGKQTGDVERHHDEEKRNSSQRKDDHGRDGTHEIERSRIPSKGREDIPQFQQHQDMRSAHYERRGQGVERVKERDGSVGGRQRREDDAYGRRGKDEDAKRDQEKEIELRHKNKVMGTEKKGKDEDPHSRRHVDDGDWKGHHYRDGTTRQRDREDNLMSRREPLDDLHVKRRKDEEQRRREKVSKEDSQHGYRGREDGSHGKRERDDGADHRRREDQARVRDKSENHHSIRHRDENWRQREREDRLRFKQPREDTQKHKEREEGRSINRSGRVLEEKTTGGSGSRAADIYPPKDRRRHGDQHRRVDRGEEHTHPEHEVHEEMHTRDYQLSRKEKNSRHERLISHNDHSLTASDGEKVHRERSRKGKEIEVREPNIATGKRKLEDNVSNKSEKGGMNGTNDHEGNTRSYGMHSQKGHQLNDEPPDIQGQNHSSENHEEEHVASDDDNPVRRGRSKLERWTSHKERDYINSSIHSLSSSSKVGELEVNNDDISQHDELIKTEDNNILDSDIKDMEVAQVSDMTGKESDRHLDTVAKLKKRSERFKLPMPGDKETAMPRKSENETSLVQSETVADADIKHERPARKRRWSSS